LGLIIFSMCIDGLLIIVLFAVAWRFRRRAVLPIESTSLTPHRGICIVSIVSSSAIPVSATFVKSHPIVPYRKVGRNFGLSSLRRNDRGYTQWRRPHICPFVCSFATSKISSEKNKPKSLLILSLFHAYFVLKCVLCYRYKIVSSFVVVSAMIEKIIAIKILNNQNTREIKKSLNTKMSS